MKYLYIFLMLLISLLVLLFGGGKKKDRTADKNVHKR